MVNIDVAFSTLMTDIYYLDAAFSALMYSIFYLDDISFFDVAFSTVMLLSTLMYHFRP